MGTIKRRAEERFFMALDKHLVEGLSDDLRNVNFAAVSVLQLLLAGVFSLEAMSLELLLELEFLELLVLFGLLVLSLLDFLVGWVLLKRRMDLGARQ